MPFNTPLEAAIAHLVARGDIKSGADVARDLGLKSRGTISSYAKGTAKMSANFQTMFENRYNVRLADFSNTAQPNNNHLKNGDDYKDKYIAAIEEKVVILEQQLAQKEKRIDEVLNHFNSKLTGLEQAQAIIAAYVQAYFRAFAIHRSKTEKLDLKKVEAEMGKLYDEGLAQVF